MRVVEIWRYPVKSLGGERLDSAAVDDRGIDGDRTWGIFDPVTGLILTARREPRLLFLNSRLVDGRPVISTDAGRSVLSDDELSSWIGRPVELRAASDGPGTFENPIDIDNEDDWIQWQSSGDTFHDGHSRISLVSVASLGEWDARRFRINLIVDDGNDHELSGDVGVGSVVLSIRKPIDRCVMVARAQPGIDKDLSVLKRIIAERDNKMGVGAVITTAGTIAVGDRFG